ncbi:MAG: tyrosine-type recombinase/integrase [Polaromonas sp.]
MPTLQLARLLYGTGMRLAEGLNLRVKDVDFERHVILVRSGKEAARRLLLMGSTFE